MSRLMLADMSEGSFACIESLQGHAEVLDQLRELGFFDRLLAPKHTDRRMLYRGCSSNHGHC